jgi:hypothetical protein
MVYYFTSNVVLPSAYIYMGKDKVESRVNLHKIAGHILIDGR